MPVREVKCQGCVRWRREALAEPGWLAAKALAGGRHSMGCDAGAWLRRADAGAGQVSDPTVVDVAVSHVAPRIVLSDGRALSAPPAWFPRLRDVTPAQRQNWEAIARGHGVHWPDIDEDISVRALMGRPT
jgi:hypothetical protein